MRLSRKNLDFHFDIYINKFGELIINNITLDFI